MDETLLTRIDAADDKTLCLIVNTLTQTLARSAPPDVRSAKAIGPRLATLARDAGQDLALDVEGAWVTKRLGAAESVVVARALLKQLAVQPGGDLLVRTALDGYSDTTQDFAVLSAGVAAGFLYLAVVCGFDVELKGVRITKAGLTPQQQVEIAKSLLPEFVKAAFDKITGA